MNTAKLIESIEADKFHYSEIVINDQGHKGVRFYLTPNKGFVVGEYHFDIASIEAYGDYFTINFIWAKVQHTYNPITQEGGEDSIDVDTSQMAKFDGEMDYTAISDHYYYELWEYLKEYLQPDY